MQQAVPYQPRPRLVGLSAPSWSGILAFVQATMALFWFAAAVSGFGRHGGAALVLDLALWLLGAHLAVGALKRVAFAQHRRALDTVQWFAGWSVPALLVAAFVVHLL